MDSLKKYPEQRWTYRVDLSNTFEIKKNVKEFKKYNRAEPQDYNTSKKFFSFFLVYICLEATGSESENQPVSTFFFPLVTKIIENNMVDCL